jgi:hypothetical protein
MTTPTTREALARLVELDDQSPTAFEIGTDPQWTTDWHQAIHQARQALAPRVAMPWPEPKADAPSDPVQAVMDAAMGRDGEPIPRVAAAALRAAAAQIAAADPPPHVRGDTYWPWCNGRATAEEHLLAIATELEGVNG